MLPPRLVDDSLAQRTGQQPKPALQPARRAEKLRVDQSHLAMPRMAPVRTNTPFGPVVSAAGLAPWELGPALEPPEVDQAELMRLYTTGEHAQLIDRLLQLLQHYANHTYMHMSPELQRRINNLVEILLFLLTKQDLEIPREKMVPLLNLHPVITNLVAVSSFRTTDAQLDIVGRQQQNLLRLLLLYSARNKTWIHPRLFFDVNPFLASLWYMLYPLSTGPGVLPETYENVQRYLEAIDDRFQVIDPRITHLYFLSTNINPALDRKVKEQIHADLRRRIGQVEMCNHPAPDHVAIVTGKWWPGSAVYKSSYPMVRTLEGHYRLTLVHLGDGHPMLDTSLFSEVIHVRFEGDRFDLSRLVGNSFQLAYYPDVGMLPESIWLADLRIAPIQVMGYGHPASTFGSQIDYIIGGLDSELLEEAEQNYSERLVAIPGIGAHPVYPDYRRNCTTDGDSDSHTREQVLINCSWGASKINYPMLKNLLAIRRRARRKIRFQFFPNWSVERFNLLLPLCRDLQEIFGHDVSVVSNAEYPLYMQRMEQAQFSLDSYPFGGYNTIVDSLYLGKPVVTYEGRQFYNRAASALLRKVGLEELVARSDEEYIEKAVRLADDERYRQQLTQRLLELDLKARLFDTEEPQYFRRAIDFLIENHTQLAAEQSRQPIVIA